MLRFSFVNAAHCLRSYAVLLSVVAGTAQAAPFGYITNQNGGTVSVIDGATNTVITTFPTASLPYGSAVNPAGQLAYVANAGSNNVSVIDTATNIVLTNVTVGTLPYGVAVNPAGTRVYVTNNSSGNVSVINTATNTVGPTITVGTKPYGVAVSPDGTRVYVGNNESNSVSIIDSATNAVINTLSVGTGPVGVAFNPSGTRVYVANSAGTVSVINTATEAVVNTVTVGTTPGGVAFNHAGTRAYVANFGSANVSVIDTATEAVLHTVTVGLQPLGVAVNPAGTAAYVANYGDGTVSVIDTSTDTVLTTVTVGSGPVAFGLFIGVPAPTITNGPPPNGTVSIAYDFAYTSTGSPTFSVTDGALPAGLNLSAAGAITGTPTNAGTFTGTVTASNGTPPDATQAFSITIVGLEPAPVNVVATAMTATSVDVMWTAVPGRLDEVLRLEAGAVSTTVGTSTSGSLTDNNAVQGTAYLYFVHGISPAFTELSTPDLATTVIFTDPALVIGVTTIKADHITQLRTAVEAVQTLAGQTPSSYTHPTVGAISAVDGAELRARLANARGSLMLTTISYAYPATAGMLIHAADITQLRGGVQ